MTTPKPTNPAAAVEVRDRCPHCGDHQLVPRRQMAEHLARLHPDVPAASGVQPDTRRSDLGPADGQQKMRLLEKLRAGLTPIEPARPEPDTERRERWAAAIAKAAGSKAFAMTGPEWHHARGAWGLHADAALAVADEEQRNLRAELADVRRDADYFKGWADGNGKNLNTALAENARLRAELGKARATTLAEAADEAASHADFHGGKSSAGGRALLYLAKALRNAAAPGGQAEDAHPESVAWHVQYKVRGAWNHLGIYAKEQADCMVTDLATKDMETRLVRATTTYTVVAPGGQAEDGAQPTTTVDPDVVAYRNSHQPGVLLCRGHGFGWAGLTPLTSEDLPDGGTCTFGDPGDPDDRCGVDVLIPQLGPAVEDGAQKK